MKKFLISLILMSSFILVSCTTTPSQDPSVSNIKEVSDTLPIQPERKLDIYGKIVSLEGNEITLLEVDTSKDPTFSMTPSEKQKYMQSMDESARTLLKEQINSATLGEKKIIIPVGIPMIKKTAQGPTAPNIEASLADLKPGQYISVWFSVEGVDKKSVEFVKIAFTQ